MQIVITNGCFDLLHAGHLELLRACTEYAGYKGRVIVALNSDTSVRRLKGEGRPVQSEQERKRILEALYCVDEVQLFDTEYDLETFIMLCGADLLVKGEEYRHQKITGANIIPVKFVPMKPGISTTSIIQKLTDIQKLSTVNSGV